MILLLLSLDIQLISAAMLERSSMIMSDCSRVEAANNAPRFSSDNDNSRIENT